MKRKSFILLSIIIIPILILIADYYIFNKEIPMNALAHDGAQWDYIIQHKDEIPSSLLQLATRNEETIAFVANYVKEHKQTRSMNIKNDLNKNQVPLLLQWDARWGYKNYGNDMMAINGCGPTVLSMVASYLKQDPSFHPYYIARYAMEYGYTDGDNTYWSLMDKGARQLGLNVKELSLSEDSIINELKQGNPIICSMSKGIFTSTGHFIVLREYKDGLIYVNDPNSQKKSQKGYTFEEIQYQIKNLWSYSL